MINIHPKGTNNTHINALLAYFKVFLEGLPLLFIFCVPGYKYYDQENGDYR